MSSCYYSREEKRGTRRGIHHYYSSTTLILTSSIPTHHKRSPNALPQTHPQNRQGRLISPSPRRYKGPSKRSQVSKLNKHLISFSLAARSTFTCGLAAHRSPSVSAFSMVHLCRRACTLLLAWSGLSLRTHYCSWLLLPLPSLRGSCVSWLRVFISDGDGYSGICPYS